ncbi:hypothetical protein [Flavobacterium sp.]|uniref:hypothetical protein n=1 Tax=Flavobacterium sp. TaxID=239 RepID=UPI00404816D3
MITGLLIAVVIAFGAYIYKFPPKKVSSIQTLTPTSNPDKICMDYLDRPSELSVDLIHTMVNKYKGEQLKCINSNSRIKDDAHSIWFDLETLKKFIYHVEKTTIAKATSDPDLKSLNITKEKLGIRIYYAAYPHFDSWKNHSDLDDFSKIDGREKYEHLHTVIMIPTLEISKGKMADFNPLDSDTYVSGLFDKPGYTFSLNNPTPANSTIGLSGMQRSSTNQNMSTSAQNHGGLIPPENPNGEGF